MWREVGSAFEKRIHEAIVLACEDMLYADELLEEIREEAVQAGDRVAILACLKALSVVLNVTGVKDGRWLGVCRQLVEADPDNPSNLLLLGKAEEVAGHYNAAGRAYLGALALSKDAKTDELLRDALDRLAARMAKTHSG